MLLRYLVTHGPALLHQTPCLLGQVIAGVVDLEVAALGNNFLGSEGALCESPSRLRPPLLDGLDVVNVLLVLLLEGELRSHVGGSDVSIQVQRNSKDVQRNNNCDAHDTEYGYKAR